MQGAYRSSTWLRFNKLRRKKRVQTGMTFALVFLGPLLAVATFLALGFLNQSANTPSLRVILLADFVYVDANGRQVVEDVKGAVTPEFRLKRKLMLWRHGIEVKEVRS